MFCFSDALQDEFEREFEREMYLETRKETYKEIKKARREEERNFQDRVRRGFYMRLGDAVWKSFGITHVVYDAVRFTNGQEAAKRIRSEMDDLLSKQRTSLHSAIKSFALLKDSTDSPFLKQPEVFKVADSPFGDIKTILESLSELCPLPLDPRSIDAVIQPIVLGMSNIWRKRQSIDQLSYTGFAHQLQLSWAEDQQSHDFCMKFQRILYNFSSLRHPPLSSLDDPSAFLNTGRTFANVLYNLKIFSEDILRVRRHLLKVKPANRADSINLQMLQEKQYLRYLPSHIKREVNKVQRFTMDIPITPLMEKALFNDPTLIQDELVRSRAADVLFPYDTFDTRYSVDLQLESMHKFVMETITRALESLESPYPRAVLHAAVRMPSTGRFHREDDQTWKLWMTEFLSMPPEDQAKAHAFNLTQKVQVKRKLNAVPLTPSEKDFRAWIFAEKQRTPRIPRLTSDPSNRQRPLADNGDIFVKRAELMLPHFGLPFVGDEAWLSQRRPSDTVNWTATPLPKPAPVSDPYSYELVMPGDIARKAEQARLDLLNTPFGILPPKSKAPRRSRERQWKSTMFDLVDWATKPVV